MGEAGNKFLDDGSKRWAVGYLDDSTGQRVRFGASDSAEEALSMLAHVLDTKGWSAARVIDRLAVISSVRGETTATFRVEYAGSGGHDVANFDGPSALTNAVRFADACYGVGMWRDPEHLCRGRDTDVMMAA